MEQIPEKPILVIRLIKGKGFSLVNGYLKRDGAFTWGPQHEIGKVTRIKEEDAAQVKLGRLSYGTIIWDIDLKTLIAIKRGNVESHTYNYNGDNEAVDRLQQAIAWIVKAVHPEYNQYKAV